MLRNIFSNSYAKVREINDKYRTPGIEMSGGVKLALFALRLYLICLIGLSFYKFVTLLK
ncbi:MAG: hypothetical protein M0033_02140 [Nitrospiraceae bacterium]|nr:hypothetical protein [Nitrospiraceae bacterium]MDA8324998.1 hypothetical protein [Nitrospiraceae bacterium]